VANTFDPFSITHYPTIRPSSVVPVSIDTLVNEKYSPNARGEYPQYVVVQFEDIYRYLLPENRRDPMKDSMLNFLGVHPNIVIQPMVEQLYKAMICVDAVYDFKVEFRRMHAPPDRILSGKIRDKNGLLYERFRVWVMKRLKV